MDKFPEEIIFNILSRVTVKSLLKLRCVSKSWCKIIDDPTFCHMQFHCGRVEQEIPLIIESLNAGNLYAAYKDEKHMKIIKAGNIPIAKIGNYLPKGSCNGLVYFEDYMTGNIVVSNPLKNQFSVLPPPWEINMQSNNMNNIVYGLGFDSLTKTFKMVCTWTTSDSNPLLLHSSLHTLGTSSWRKLSTAPACSICGDGVFVHGNLHWRLKLCTYNQNYKDYSTKIVSFDVSKEKFEVISYTDCYPKDDESNLSNMSRKLLDIGGELAMVDILCTRKTYLWIMQYEQKEWIKMCSFDMIDPLYVVQVTGIWKPGQILLRSKQYCIYNMKTSSSSDEYFCDFGPSIYCHRGSLISVPSAKC